MVHDEAYIQLASATVMRAICDYVNFSMLDEQLPLIEQSKRGVAMIHKANEMPPDFARSILTGWMAYNESLGKNRAYCSKETYRLIYEIDTEEKRNAVCKRLYRTMVNKIHIQHLHEYERTKEVEKIAEFFLSDRFALYTDGRISGKALLMDLDQLIRERKERRNARDNVRKFYGLAVKCPDARPGKRRITRRITQEVRFEGSRFTVAYRASKA